MMGSCWVTSLHRRFSMDGKVALRITFGYTSHPCKDSRSKDLVKLMARDPFGGKMRSN